MFPFISSLNGAILFSISYSETLPPNPFDLDPIILAFSFICLFVLRGAERYQISTQCSRENLPPCYRSHHKVSLLFSISLFYLSKNKQNHRKVVAQWPQNFNVLQTVTPELFCFCLLWSILPASTAHCQHANNTYKLLKLFQTLCICQQRISPPSCNPFAYLFYIFLRFPSDFSRVGYYKIFCEPRILLPCCCKPLHPR